MILLHGTTRQRAERILALGPDPRFCEPGGQTTENGFSTYLDLGPFLFGAPDEYAHGMAREFPDEGGPVILVLQVPDAIVQKAITDWFPLSQGLVQFEPGSGLEELLAVWSQIASSALIRSLT
jgi:hypothetical protein